MQIGAWILLTWSKSTIHLSAPAKLKIDPSPIKAVMGTITIGHRFNVIFLREKKNFFHFSCSDCTTLPLFL